MNVSNSIAISYIALGSVLNFKQIEAFVHAARNGGVSAASVALNTSQPAISIRLRELERDLGVELIDRSRRGFRLTPEGREFLEHATDILERAEAAWSRFGDGSNRTGRLRLGVTETIALTWLPELVQRINAAYPALVVELDVDLTAGVWKKLNDGDIEVGLLPGPTEAPGLTAASLGFIRYDWMASPQLDIPKRTLLPKDLARWPVITLGAPSNLHSVIDEWFRRAGQRPRCRDVCNSLGAVASMTRAGIGVSLLPPFMVDDRRAETRLRRLKTDPPLPDLEFVMLSRQGASSPLIRFVQKTAESVSTFDRTPQVA